MKHTIEVKNCFEFKYIRVIEHVSRTCFKERYNVFDIIDSPTGNCQLSSLRNADNITFINLKYKQDQKQLIKVLKKNTKRSFLVDIKNIHKSRLKNILLPYTDIIIEKDYINRGVSNMCIMIFKWK